MDPRPEYPFRLRDPDPNQKPLPGIARRRRGHKEDPGQKPEEDKSKQKEKPQAEAPAKLKCFVCWRMIEDLPASRRQHRLSIYHRTWKYYGQGLNWSEAQQRAKDRFQEHWRADFEDGSMESELPQHLKDRGGRSSCSCSGQAQQEEEGEEEGKEAALPKPQIPKPGEESRPEPARSTAATGRLWRWR